MIRRATLSLNEATGKKHEAIDNLIVMYLYFLQKVINALWNHKIFFGKFVPKQWYKDIKTPLTERYKQCAAKQALAVVKSPQKGKRKTKPVIHNASLELDSRFVKIEMGKNSFDLWIKLSILGGKPIYIPAKRHYHFNKFFNSGWELSNSCRLRRTEKGEFLDVFFEREAEPVKDKGKVVGLDLGFRKLAVLSDGQIVGKELKEKITRFYKRKKSHQIIREVVNHNLKLIPFSNIQTLVIERLKNVKKGRGKKARRGKRFSRHANRLLSHWAYRHARARLSMLCEENRVQLVEVKVDADYNAACNIRDRWIAQGVYGPLPENHLTIPSG